MPPETLPTEPPLVPRSPRLQTMARLLRVLGALEGFSYVFLLAVAMPLKYIYDLPIAVRVTGAMHGILFVAYCGALHVAFDAGMRGRDVVKGFVASLLPFGFVAFDPILRRYLAQPVPGVAAGPDDVAPVV